MDIYLKLKVNLDIINVFVIETNNEHLTKMWRSINYMYNVAVNEGHILSKQQLVKNMFDLYTFFIEQLNIELKIAYIKLYENQLGIAWEQILFTTKQFNNSCNIKNVDLKWYSNGSCWLFGVHG